MDKWCDIDAPWLDEDKEKCEKFLEDLLGKVSIIDILDKYNIEYTKCSGKFTHKLKCPLPAHANGQERTASFYVSETENFFFCFGCNLHGNVIDFTRLYLGIPNHKALELLYKLSKNSKNVVPIKRFKHVEAEFTVDFYIFKASEFLRKFLKSKEKDPHYLKWVKWIDERFKRMDFKMEHLGEDWAAAKSYYKRVVKAVQEHNID